jgi:hypothetical protein
LLSSPRWLRVLRITAGALSVTVALLLLVTIGQAGRILPGTVVAGVDVGGRDVASARRILSPALEREAARPIAVSAPGQRILLRPRDAGLLLDTAATVDAAFARGRTTSLTSVIARVSAPLRPVALAPRGTVDVALLLAWVEATADRLDREPDVGDLSIDAETLEVRIRGPVGGVRIDRAASADRLRAALLDPQVDRVELVASVVLPPSSFADIEVLAERVGLALEGPLVLHHEERRLSIEPQVLAGLLVLASEPVDGRSAGAPTGATEGLSDVRLRPVLTVPRERVRSELGPVGRATFDRVAGDARFVTERPPPVELRDLSSVTFWPVPTEVPIVPSTSRVAFDPARTAAQISELVSDGRRIAPADLFERDPAITTEAALAGRPTHLLGTFTTAHAAGAARTINIRLLADLLDDRLIAPGEEFSVNGVSGPRRCEDGFVPAGTIIRGELVDTCGGGVSQFGTTILNAAFFAGLTLEQWQPHSFFISRYPAGREATLSYPELDVRFVNDTDGWLVLRTAHTPDSITVSLYGVPRWESVRADHGEPRAPTTFTEVVRVAPDLRPGARRVVQSGGNGFTLTVTRTRTALDPASAPAVERWTTVYRPQQRIVEVGAAAPVRPEAPAG